MADKYLSKIPEFGEWQGEALTSQTYTKAKTSSLQDIRGICLGFR